SSTTKHKPRVMASTTTTTTTTTTTSGKKDSSPATSTANTYVRCLPHPPTYRLTIAD
ncbi:unnamed protein product, partial [Rotaria magnacalcarata]